MEVSGQLHTLAYLTPGKERLLPSVYVYVWTIRSVWTLWRGDKFVTSAENRVRNLVTVHTVLFRPI